MLIILTLLLLTCKIHHTQGAKPEPVYRIVYEIESDAWYQEQAKLWQQEIDKERNNMLKPLWALLLEEASIPKDSTSRYDHAVLSQKIALHKNITQVLASDGSAFLSPATGVSALFDGEGTGYAPGLGKGACAYGLNLVLAYELFKNEAFKQAARYQIDHVLGVNAMSKSFVTDVGIDYVRYPHHKIVLATQKLVPGLLSEVPMTTPRIMPMKKV